MINNLVINLKEKISIQKPNLPQALHYISQLSYLLIVIYYVKAARYWDWYFYTVAFAYFLNLLGYKYILRKKLFYFNIVPLLISTSVFLFITGYSLNTYLAAIFIAMFFRFFVRINDGPVFNPSAIAIVAMACLGEGIYATPVIALADRLWWIPFIVLMGCITTFFSNRLFATLSYLGCLIFFILVFNLLGSQYILVQIGTVLGFSSLLFSFHVLTDPKTTPNSTKELIIFGILLALLDVSLRSMQVALSNIVALIILNALYSIYKLEKSARFNKSIVVFIPISLILIGIYIGFFPKPYLDPLKYGAYQKQESISPKKLPFFYEVATNKVGLNIINEKVSEDQRNNIKSILFNSFPAPINSSADINNDGLYDFMTSGSRIQFRVLKNIKGEKFEDITTQLKIDEKLASSIIASIFIDINNDGLEDIFAISSDSKHPFLLFMNKKGSFSDESNNFGLDKFENQGRTTSISIFDYDLDGYLDLLIANYPNIDEIPENVVLSKDFIYSSKPKRNLILKNVNGKKIIDVTEQLIEGKNEFTHAVGISDLNNDGYPDLYFSNDVGRDKVYYNKKGKAFENVTGKVLGHIFARNGMGVDFTDLNGTGFQSIYVSNISRGNYRHGMNYFWNNVNGKNFQNVSNDLDIGRCGYSWGPKFFDPNLDGNIDLLVGAGYKNGSVNAWYMINAWESMPNNFKSKDSISSKFPIDLELAGDQRKCFFWNNGEKFIDIAQDTGLTDYTTTRTVTLVDMKNNANPLIIAGNLRSPRIVAYENKINSQNNWVGLNLIGTKSNRSGIGSKIKYSKNSKFYTKEIFPTNGVSSLHDRRFVIGLGQLKTLPEIEIRWPSGISQKIYNLKINSYNNIQEIDKTISLNNTLIKPSREN